MIDEKTLTKCLDNLAEINAHLTNNALKRLTLEVGYILKQELDSVHTWNQQFSKNGKLKDGMQIDVNKLLEDNNQLFNENAKLHELNMKLKQVIDERIPNVEQAIGKLNTKFETFSDILSKA